MKPWPPALDWAAAVARPPAELAPALLETHHALHLVAAAGQAFAPPRADGAHRAMTWDGVGRRFVGAAFDGAYPFRVSLAPEELRLAILERSGAPLGDLSLPGRTLAEAYEWLGKAATTYLGRPFGAVPPPDFAIEGHDGAGRRFTTAPVEERAAVGSLLQASAALLDDLATRHGASGPVRCWAHDFELSARLGGEGAATDVSTRSVGLGMACGGAGGDPWYWFVDAWPRLEVGDLPPLSGPGRWHPAPWTGAILSADDVHGRDVDARGVVAAFFEEALDRVRRAMDFHGPEA